MSASAFAVATGGTEVSDLSNIVKLNGTYTVTTGENQSVTLVSSSEGKLNLEVSSSKSKDIQFSSDSKSSNSIPETLDSITISDIKNYIKFAVDGAGTITVTSSVGSSSSASATDSCIGAMYDADGKLIGKTDSVLAKSGGTTTLTGSTTKASDVYIVFFRSAAKGSFRVTKIEVTAPTE